MVKLIDIFDERGEIVLLFNERITNVRTTLDFIIRRLHSDELKYVAGKESNYFMIMGSHLFLADVYFDNNSCRLVPYPFLFVKNDWAYWEITPENFVENSIVLKERFEKDVGRDILENKVYPLMVSE
ncbi:hypothetical protein J4436_02050 [Candidatus Woesearchaeota archaeon]|nr:hypothetical protein [Candidatus Woesearchaeota archaeon]